MRIYVRADNVDHGEVAGTQPGPGYWRFFTDDLVLMKVGKKTPGLGLPSKEKNRRAGSLSGFTNTLRIAKANDKFYLPDSHLIQYQAVYRFNGVPNSPLKRGQIIVRGVLYLDDAFAPVGPPNKAAIVGGTDAYRLARGEVIERPNGVKELDIQL
jgi:hypothetical protein